MYINPRYKTSNKENTPLKVNYLTAGLLAGTNSFGLTLLGGGPCRGGGVSGLTDGLGNLKNTIRIH